MTGGDGFARSFIVGRSDGGSSSKAMIKSGGEVFCNLTINRLRGRDDTRNARRRPSSTWRSVEQPFRKNQSQPGLSADKS